MHKSVSILKGTHLYTLNGWMYSMWIISQQSCKKKPLFTIVLKIIRYQGLNLRKDLRPQSKNV